MASIWYIHGANSTPTSFNYVRSRLPQHDARLIRYDHARSVMGVVEMLVGDLAAAGEPVTLVGHSLGGVIAMVTAARAERVQNVVTMAAPLGGSQSASVMRWLTASPLLNDIEPNSPLITACRRLSPRITVPVLSVVTTAGGSSLLTGENDGVVTVESQTALKIPRYVRVPYNHFEVLLSDTVVDLLNNTIFI